MDCSKALELDNSLDKAYYRRGLSRKELHQYKLALTDFKKALELSPNDDNIKQEIDSLQLFLSTTSKVRIQPALKMPHLQSKVPMKQVAIKNENVVANSTDVNLADDIKKLVFSRTPKSYNEFEFDWRTLSALGNADKLEYLEMIGLTCWENIFKFSFEPKMLLQVLQTLWHSKNQQFVFQVLQLLTKMPRFNLSVEFFDQDEFQGKNYIS